MSNFLICQDLILEISTILTLKLLPAQFNTNSTHIWNNTIHPDFLKIVDFSVNYWLYLRYEKAKIYFPEDFKPLASNCLISSFIPNTYC